ncbi:MAG: GGDEF domain-containing protein [Rhizobacter sp.]|jgi:diguanylate cyclase (GGDEF)-like protein
MSASTPAEPRAEAARSATPARRTDRQRQCLQMLAVVFISYTVDTALLLGLAHAGALDALVPWTYAAAGAVACGIFSLLLRLGRSESLSDPYLVVPQMLVHSAINLAFMMWVPGIGVLLLMNLLIIHAFGAMKVSRSHVLATSALIAVGVGAVIGFSDLHLDLPMNTGLQRVISVAWFALILARSTLLDLYGAELRDMLMQRNAKLRKKFEKMHRRANRDGLTGTLSRRSVMELLSQQHRKLELTGQSFAIILLDIDHFKQVNDRFGHQVGDEVLRYFSKRAAAEMRDTDRLGRYGGEEFLAVLTATEDASSAHLAAERVRDGVAKHDWGRVAPELRVTVSLGVAVCQPEESIEQLLARADAALYAAKRAGRDCVRMG